MSESYRALRERKLELEVKQLELETETLEQKVTTERASLAAEAPFVFNGPIEYTNVAKFISTLDLWSRRAPGAPMRIIFNTPGGYVMPGLALYDFIQELRQRGHFVETRAIGQAASMGGALLQAGDKRTMSPRAYLMLHEVSSANAGTIAEIEDEVKFSKRLQDNILDILEERATKTRATIARRIKKSDWWMSAEEALAEGFIDEIS